MIGVPIAALFNLAREQIRLDHLSQLRAMGQRPMPVNNSAQAQVLDRMRQRSQTMLMSMAAQRGVAPMAMYGASMDPALVQAMMARR